MTWLDGGTSGSLVDVTKCLDSNCFRSICQWIEAGALVSFGTTSDGGALGITVTVDGVWRREYVRSAEELEQLVTDATEDIVSLALTSRASAAQRKRGRGTKRP